MWSRWRGICCRRVGCSRSWPGIAGSCSRRRCSPICSSRGGRPSMPAEVIASVIVLQTLHGLSDAEAVEAVTFDLRWKAACGLAVTATGVSSDDVDLLAASAGRSARPNRIFDAVRAVVAADRGAGREDPSGVGLHGARRRGRHPGHRHPADRGDPPGRPGGARRRRGDRRAVLRRTTTPSRASRGSPGTTRRRASSWSTRWSSTRTGCSGTCPSRNSARGPPRRSALLALVAGQDVEPAEGSDGTDGRWRIARKVAPDRVISTVDPETRHAHKTRARRQDGYKAHVKVEPDTGLITGCALTPAAGPAHSDAAVGIELLADEPDPLEVLGDSAYGTGELLDIAAAGRAHRAHQAVAAAPGRGRRVHHRRFHRRRGGRHGDLPEPGHPPDHRHPDGDLRGALPRTARCGPAAPPRPRGARCGCIRTTRCSARTEPAPPTRSSRPSTGSTGPWSNARSPGWSPAGTDGCGSAGHSATICGCTTASPR